MKDIQGPYIAWYQAPMSRILVEITSAPKWTVRQPYLYNWKRPQWTVEIREMVDNGTVCSGQPEMLTKHLHPLNEATRELLALRNDLPPSPVVVPEVPEIVFPSAEEEMQKAKMDAFRDGVARINALAPPSDGIPVRKGETP